MRIFRSMKYVRSITPWHDGKRRSVRRRHKNTTCRAGDFYGRR